jgi:hypothetical protein
MARKLQRNGIKFFWLMDKSKFYLGMKTERGTVDALTQTFIALRTDEGDYLVFGWDEYESEGEENRG